MRRGNDYLGVWKSGKEGASEKGGVKEGRRGMSYDERPCFLFLVVSLFCLFLVLFLSGFLSPPLLLLLLLSNIE